MSDELRLKIEKIENELDIRVESLILEINGYRDECRKKLHKLKNNFKKYH